MANIERSANSSVAVRHSVREDVRRPTARGSAATELLRELDVAIKIFFANYDRSKTPEERKRISDKIALASRVQNVLKEEVAFG